MRIGIDILSNVPNQLSGATTYLVNLIRNLAKIDTENQYFIFAVSDNAAKIAVKQDNFTYITCKIPNQYREIRIAWEQVILPLQVMRYKIEVMHFPGGTMPLAVPCKSVLTIHDLSSFYYTANMPSYMPKRRLFYLNNLIKYSCRKADYIITDSSFSRKEILTHLKVSPNRIAVVYLASSPMYEEAVDLSSADQILRDYGINGEYILYVGTGHKHKNLDRLVEAFTKLKCKQGIPHKLVWAGRQGSGYNDLMNTIKSLGMEEEVIYIGYVPNQHLALLYRTASLLVFPSLYEGFGLPLLEAMTYGVPIASSTAGSLPEVAGDAVVYFHPCDIDEMAEVIFNTLKNKELRKKLINKGFERIKRFSWENTARNTLEVFKKVAQG